MESIPGTSGAAGQFPPLVERVAGLAGDRTIHLVGGAVRDALLRHETHDFDFVVQSDAIGLGRSIAQALQADFYVLDQRFDAGRVLLRKPDGARDVIDFSSYRGPDLASDLAGRDFTINAIAYDPKTGRMLDPVHGGNDLQEGVICACSPASLRDDPIRILRAIRLAITLGFRIEPATRSLMKEAVELLAGISAERQRDELFRMLGGPRPDAALRAMDYVGTLPFTLPELVRLHAVEQAPPHVHDVWNHTLSVVRSLDEMLGVLVVPAEAARANGLLAGILSGKLGRYRRQFIRHFEAGPSSERSRRSLLFFAATYHDVAKPACRYTAEDGSIHFMGHDRDGADVAEARGKELKLSRAEIAHAGDLVRNHMRFSLLARRMEEQGTAPSRRAIYRFFRDTGPAAVELILLGLADLQGTRGHSLGDHAWSAFVDTARLLLESYWDRPEQDIAPVRLLDGTDLIQAYGLAEGPVIGQLLAAIREAQAEGSISTREEALAFGGAWLKASRSRGS